MALCRGEGDRDENSPRIPALACGRVGHGAGNVKSHKRTDHRSVSRRCWETGRAYEAHMRRAMAREPRSEPRVYPGAKGAWLVSPGQSPKNADSLVAVSIIDKAH